MIDDVLRDPERLASLESYRVAGTPPEAPYDALARLAARLVDAPIAMVNFVDGENQHFKARHNLELEGVPNGMGFCPVMITSGQDLTVENTELDPRFRDDPATKEPFGVRAAASVPLRDPKGLILGSICVLDTRVREFTPTQLESLHDLATQAQELLSLRRESRLRAASDERYEGAMKTSPEGFAMLRPARDEEGRLTDFIIDSINTLGARSTGGTVETLIGTRLDEAPAGPVQEPLASLYRRVADGGPSEEVEITFPGGAISRYRASLSGGAVAVNFSDVTDVRRTAANLRDVEDRFRLAGEAAGVGVWEMDMDGGGSYRSKVHDEIFGYPEGLDEFRFPFFLQHVVPEDRSGVRATYDWLLQGGEGWTFQCRIRPRLDGAIRWIEVRSRRVPRGSSHVIGTVMDVTARVSAEAAQRESELRFRTLAEGISQVVWSTDAKGENFRALRWEEYVGAPVESFHGEGWRDFVHVEDHGRFRGMWRRAIATGVLDGEFRLLSHGRYRWVNTRGAPVRDADGAVTEWVGITLDVDGRRKTEAELAEIFEALPQIVWRTDGAGRVTFFNRQWFSYTGQPREESGGETWLQYLHPDDVARTGHHWAECRRTGATYEVEYRIRNGATGEYRWFLARGRALRDTDGSIDRWLGTCTDIHERRLSQEALALIDEISSRTRALAEPEDVIATTEDILGKYLGASRCAYGTVEPDGNRFRILRDYVSGVPTTVGDYSLELFGPRAVEQMRSGKTLVIKDRDAELGPGEGREMFEAIQISAIVCVPLIKEGRLRAMMAVHQAQPRNWTETETTLVREVVERTWESIERARAEADLRTLNDELEKRVDDRTAALEAANRELEGFTYTVAHDLRAPLRTMVATGRFLEEDYPDEVTGPVLDLVRRQSESARKLGQLMDELLQLARLSREKVERRVIDLTEMAIEEGGPRMKAQPGVTANGDARLVRLLIRNLVENARKFSPENSSIQFGRAAGGAFFVRDRGIGFDPRYAHKLFLPFERLVKDDQYPGSGVGLANVKRIAERHGGRVWAEGKPGEGATFYFTLGLEA